MDEGYPYCVDGVPAPNTDGKFYLSGFFDTNGHVEDGCEDTGIFYIESITPAFIGTGCPTGTGNNNG